MDTVLSEDLEGGIHRITLNRPELRNALDWPSLDRLLDSIATIPREARCLVLAGKGKSFCSGADLTVDFAAIRDPAGKSIDRHITPIIEALHDLPIPIVSAVNGAAAGFGCSLALAGDIIVASQEASFVQAFVNMGLVPDGGATWAIPRVVGRARAMEMFLLGERIPAPLALEWGLINRVVENERLGDTALDLARRLASGPTAAMGRTRKLVRRASETTLSEALRLERDAQSQSAETADFGEAVAAFRERRVPSFSGR